MLPLVAEFTPLSPSAQLAVVSLLVVAATLLSIWNMVRRRPPLDAQIARFEATIDTLRKAVDELTEAQRAAASHSSRISQLESECAELRSALDRRLSDQRRDTDGSITKLYLRIESFEKAVTGNFQTVERSLGRIEGQLAGKG
ncbi:MAG TPA: hypothetical protein VK163_08885 [Opitutaceae bacterium]|nr:hypothetical protein [Opitutaceae bacterium]